MTEGETEPHTMQEFYGFLGNLPQTGEVGLRDFGMLALLDTPGITPTHIVSANISDLVVADDGSAALAVGAGEKLVPLPDSAAALIARYLSTYRADAEGFQPLFISRSFAGYGQPLEVKFVQTLRSRYFGKAFRSDADFRYALTSLAFRAGASESQLQELGFMMKAFQEE